MKSNVRYTPSHIVRLIHNPFVHEGNNYHKEHAVLEIKFADFLTEFQLVKIEIFRLAEDLIRYDKNHIIEHKTK